MSDSKPTDIDKDAIELLEKSIQDNSPEFLKELETISEIGSENLDLELVNIDLIIEQQEANSLKARAKRTLRLFNQLGLKIFYFVKSSLILLVKETGPHYLKIMLTSLKSIGVGVLDFLLKVKKFSKTQKVVLLIVFNGTGFLIFLLFKILTGGLIPDDDKLFVHTMEELATQKYTYNVDETEDFYNSPRVSQNIMALRRMVVNIQRSKNSGINPMGAFEFFIQGNSSEVMVEIRDREAELIDLLQNEVREFSYDELNTIAGKRNMVDKLIRVINETLTKGKITQIYFKNFVLKK